MKNCNCNNALMPPMPPAKPTAELCCEKPSKITLRTTIIPATLGTDEPGSPYAPQAGAYYNMVVWYQANNNTYIYDSNGVYTLLRDKQNDTLVKELQEQVQAFATTLDNITLENAQENAQTRGYILQEIQDRRAEDEELQEAVLAETNAREAADTNLQQQIDTINDSTDVKDVVATHAALEAYDTSTLGDNDIIKVLQDETHDDAITYYRWDKTESKFNYIGETGPYYTKSEVDTMLESYATTEYVNQQIGDINTTLTTINTGTGV